MLDHLLEVGNQALVIGKVFTLSQDNIPRTCEDMFLGIPEAIGVSITGAPYACPHVGCMLWVTWKVHPDYDLSLNIILACVMFSSWR